METSTTTVTCRACGDSSVRKGVTRLRKGVVLLTVALVLLMASPVARAWTVNNGYWPSGLFRYKVNTSSFLLNFGITQDDVARWVATALGSWKERSGALLYFTYDGSTTATPLCAANTANNGTNDVYMHPTCAEACCNTWGIAIYNPPSRPPSTPFVETDVCLFGGSAVWAIHGPAFNQTLTNPPINTPPCVNPVISPTPKDMIGVLTHEFGHALGLEHTVGTVMDSFTFMLDNTRARYPYADDLDGIRATYSSAPSTVFFRKKTLSNPWGAQTSVGALTDTNPNVATRASQAVVAYRDVWPTAVHFRRAAWPLATNPTWTDKMYFYNTYRPPGIAGKYDGSRWVAAAAGRVNGVSCGGIRVFVSDNGFDSVTTIDLNPSAPAPNTCAACCTLHEPTVAFDNLNGRWVLYWVRTGDGSNRNDVIFSMTSTDGITWGNLNDFALASVDAVDAKCRGSICLLAYVDNLGVNPIPKNVGFSLANAVPSWGAPFSESVWNARTPAVALRSGGSNTFWGQSKNLSSISEIANGWYDYYLGGPDVGTPVDMSASLIGQDGLHRFSMTGGNSGNNDLAMFYVQ